MVNGWINHGDIRRGQAILERRLRAYYGGKNHDLKPVSTNLDVILKAYVKNNDPTSATAFIFRMREQFIAKDFPNWPPFRILRKVMKSLEFSKRPDRDAHRAKLEPYFLERQKQEEGFKK
jgi:hypothetical protein